MWYREAVIVFFMFMVIYGLSRIEEAVKQLLFWHKHNAAKSKEDLPTGRTSLPIRKPSWGDRLPDSPSMVSGTPPDLQP